VQIGLRIRVSDSDRLEEKLSRRARGLEPVLDPKGHVIPVLHSLDLGVRAREHIDMASKP